jgi:hypothetical protein
VPLAAAFAAAAQNVTGHDMVAGHDTVAGQDTVAGHDMVAGHDTVTSQDTGMSELGTVTGHGSARPGRARDETGSALVAVIRGTPGCRLGYPCRKPAV